ncbi:MAG: site-2 protease family protein [Oscillatoriales cyanobacterium C42_A2020_001]|nr:site-2 protease family protein [Leptolyngbyaceae cyanobacterium C42_A2020_001]
MHPLFLLFLLGLTTYFIVQRVSDETRTPTWLLWVVAMMPAFIWSGWAIVNGGRKAPPSYLVIIPLMVCLLLYWFLIQWGRVSSNAGTTERQEATTTKQENADPPSEMPILKPIDKSEEQSLQTCFPWSIYYLQNIEYRPQAVICRGQLRSKPEVAYQTIRENVEEQFGDRFLVVFQEGANGKPFFALVANPYSKQSPGQAARDVVTRPALAISLLVITFFTTCFAWLQIVGKLGSNNGFVQISPDVLVQGLPYALSLLLILGSHELAHYLTARRYKIRATLPYFIPVLPLPWFPFGTFGAFIQLRSPIPNRRALFDVGIAGPLVGFIIALPLLIWGLAHSEVVPMPQNPELFNFQAFDPKFSLLLTLLSKLMLGSVLTTETAIKMHPVAVASSLGLVVTAFNLMPVGQLDGGHIVHAMLGQRAGAMVGQFARLMLLLLSFAQRYLMLWAIILFLMPANDEPALNDVTELDNRRDFWGIVSLAILLLIILPAPAFVTNLFNI